MRLCVDRNKRIEFIVSIVCFIFGLLILVFGGIVPSISSGQDTVSTVEGKYCSYRIERASMHSRNIYLTLELQDGNVEEYLIFANIVFDEKEFFEDTGVGDVVKLTVVNNRSVRAIEVNGCSYMSDEDSGDVEESWTSTAFWLGLVFTLIGGLAAIAQLEKKHGNRRRIRRKKR